MPHDESVTRRNVLKKQRNIDCFVRHSNFDEKSDEHEMSKTCSPLRRGDDSAGRHVSPDGRLCVLRRTCAHSLVRKLTAGEAVHAKQTD